MSQQYICNPQQLLLDRLFFGVGRHQTRRSCLRQVPSRPTASRTDPWWAKSQRRRSLKVQVGVLTLLAAATAKRPNDAGMVCCYARTQWPFGVPHILEEIRVERRQENNQSKVSEKPTQGINQVTTRVPWKLWLLILLKWLDPYFCFYCLKASCCEHPLNNKGTPHFLS